MLPEFMCKRQIINQGGRAEISFSKGCIRKYLASSQYLPAVFQIIHKILVIVIGFFLIDRPQGNFSIGGITDCQFVGCFHQL